MKGVYMKKIMILVASMLIAMAGYADEIHLVDGTVLKGSVIQITDSVVEYDPEGQAAFDTVPRDQVARIKYNTGRVQVLLPDTIYLTGGEAITCAIVRVTKDAVIYTQADSGGEKTIDRARVARLEFADGKVIDMPEAAVADTGSTEPKIQAGGYLDSIFRINVFGGGGGFAGGIVDKENRIFRAYEIDYALAAFIPTEHYRFTTFGTGGVEMEFMAPAIKFAQTRGFDLSGIKFGIRGRYGYERVTSFITDRDEYHAGLNETNSGMLMDYHYWAAGPGMSFVFTPRSNAFAFMLNFYGTAGQVFGGKLNPLTALRDSKLLWGRLAGVWPDLWNNPPIPLMAWANIYTMPSLNRTSLRGYTIRAGFGPEFALNRGFPIIIGTHITYAYTGLTMGRAPIMYADWNKKSAHHEIGAEVSVGLHF